MPKSQAISKNRPHVMGNRKVESVGAAAFVCWIAGLLASLAGVVGPWAAAPITLLGAELPAQTPLIHGTDETPGVAIIVIVGVSLVTLIAFVKTRSIWLGIAGGLLGVAVACIAMVSIGYVSSREADLFIVEARAVPQWGLYLCLAGGMVVGVSAFIATVMTHRGWSLTGLIPKRLPREEEIEVTLRRRN